ncbi:MAG: DUF4126 domain-containing protein, partial [Candidatus Thermoplasmatota archaeon]|nr:DUF4126 domain-containing protein [Candidatus Thermoplasmatota archaeon]
YLTAATSLGLGLGLAAACGFRVFIPPLMMGVAARTGRLELEEAFAWMAEDWAIVIFSMATVLEIGAYYVPWLDNLLDTVATPAAVIAGILVTSASLDGMDPTLQWVLAVVAGGGTAGVVQLGTVAVRALSTATTGGLANPAVSTVEAGACVGCILLTIFLPIIAGLLVIVLIWWAATYVLRLRKGEAEEGEAEDSGIT